MRKYCLVFFLWLSSCSSGGGDLSFYLPTLSVTCKSSSVDGCDFTNNSRYARLGLKPRYDGYNCSQVYSMYPTNYNSYFEYSIEIQLFTDPKGLFAQGIDWKDQQGAAATQAEPNKEYTLCGFIDFNSDLIFNSSAEPYIEEEFNFIFDPYSVDEWLKNQ